MVQLAKEVSKPLLLSLAIVTSVAFSLGYWASAHGHVLISAAN